MDVARRKKSSRDIVAAILKRVEQALPAHSLRMYENIAIGKKPLNNVAWFPCARVRIYGHIDHYRGADNVFPWNTTPEAAVVRISSIVAHREITVVRDAVREGEIYSAALRVSGRRRISGTQGVILFQFLSIDPNISVT